MSRRTEARQDRYPTTVSGGRPYPALRGPSLLGPIYKHPNITCSHLPPLPDYHPLYHRSLPRLALTLFLAHPPSDMADVAPAASQIEINDAIFCQHFKEVVSNMFQPQGKYALSLYERSLIHVLEVRRVQRRFQRGERHFLRGQLHPYL